MSAVACQACSAPLAAPSGGSGFVLCEKCGAPAYLGQAASPFDVLGAPRSFELDERALENRYYELSKQLHPDRFAGRPGLKVKTLELAALLNQAYLALKQPETRLEALLRECGALKDNERQASNGQLPTELAEEYFELQEALLEGEAAAPRLAAAFRGKLEELGRNLGRQLFDEARAVDWRQPATPESGRRIENILEMRRQRSYVRSMLENLERHGA